MRRNCLPHHFGSIRSTDNFLSLIIDFVINWTSFETVSILRILGVNFAGSRTSWLRDTRNASCLFCGWRRMNSPLDISLVYSRLRGQVQVLRLEIGTIWLRIRLAISAPILRKFCQIKLDNIFEQMLHFISIFQLVLIYYAFVFKIAQKFSQIVNNFLSLLLIFAL